MSMDAPTPPDPTATAQGQEKLNRQSAINTETINDVNQTTPYGSLTYNQTGVGPNGVPIMQATQTLNPAEQSLFDNTVATQNLMGSDAQQLAKNIQGSLTQAPNLPSLDGRSLNVQPLTQQMMSWGNQYMQPLFNQQQSNLNSQLASQGITQGSAAYNNAQNLQSRNVNNAYQNLFMQAEPAAYNQGLSTEQAQYQQALSSYEAPIQTLGMLLGAGQPAQVNSSLVQPPQEQIQPADYQGLVEQNYAQQNANYENTMSGIFGIGSALAGGIGRMAMPSDINVKENITQVGKLENGLPVYLFNYKKDPDGIQQIGLMAQDVEKLHPDAVTEIGGIKHVYYGKAVK